ncbi:hypothetical protein K435DRAFT_822318 [Dendrothele bispora CBS 962.96]|uniref:Uncharacterized protein n=1 Tax=Dendrothele bispora (strain CBS 962.96) TaxID=1314807 RepID=A0A4S8LAF0_DENBC|nr:hypothetical protein K435DRAFT_822318 [Dendrothele bispora CBS 962.96]
MMGGDRAGIFMFCQISAYISVKQTGNTIHGMSDWVTSSEDSEVAAASLSGTQLWLRVTADIAPAAIGTTSAVFSFTNLGNTSSLNTGWELFTGYRLGIFNSATSKLGGSVTIKYFVHASA